MLLFQLAADGALFLFRFFTLFLERGGGGRTRTPPLSTFLELLTARAKLLTQKLRGNFQNSLLFRNDNHHSRASKSPSLISSHHSSSRGRMIKPIIYNLSIP